MTIFAVIWNDRHADTEVHLFSTADKAIEFAQQSATVSAREPGDIEEGLNEFMQRSGWLYYASYSCEGDSIWVVPCELDAKVSNVKLTGLPLTEGENSNEQ